MGLRGWCQATMTPISPKENQSKTCPRSEGLDWCAADEITPVTASIATVKAPTASAMAGLAMRGLGPGTPSVIAFLPRCTTVRPDRSGNVTVRF